MNVRGVGGIAAAAAAAKRTHAANGQQGTAS